MAVSGRRQQLTRSVLQGSDEDLPVCSPCEHGGRVVEAHGFCRDCNEHMCEACYNSHLLPKLFRKHVLLDKSIMPRDAPPPDDMCAKHPGQQLEYYCKDHDKLECSKCVHIHHRTCEDVSYIQDICDDIEDTEEFKALYRTLTSIGNDVEENETKATANLTDIRSKVTETKTSIHSFRKYLNQQLDKMEEEMCKEVDILGSSDNDTIESVSDECSRLKSNVQSVVYNIDIARKTQQKMRMFITMKNTQRIVSGWQNQLHDVILKNNIGQYTFEPEKQLQFMTGQGKQLGHLVMEDNVVKPQHPGVMGKVKTTGDRSSDDKRTGPSSKRQLDTLHNMTATKDESINIKTQLFGKSCNITGSVLTSNNLLAIADNDNKFVKMVDLKRKKVIDRLILEHVPFDITQVSQHTLAVTCPYIKYIQLVKVSQSGTLSLDRQIRVGGQCHGIRYTSDGKLVVSFTDPHKVKVMDMSGTVVKDLSLDASGQPRFSRPQHIAISNDGNTLIVSNDGNNTVTGLTLDGVEKFVYRDDALVRPSGVAVGDRGEIYVCAWTPKTIHAVSGEGRKITVLQIKKDTDMYPESITYSDNKLFVGRYECNRVDVYRLQYQ